MRKIIGRFIGGMLLAVIATAGVSASAATTSDFYTTLLRRGISEVDAGRYDAAVTPLRLAAFGLVETVGQYETAQAYLAIALDKLGRADGAREATHRVIAAESVERKFASLQLPESVRTAFAVVARKSLSAPEVASLMTPPKPGVTPPPAAITPKPVPAAAKPAASTNNTAATTTAPPPATKPPVTTTASNPLTTKPANPPATKPAAGTSTTNTKAAQTATTKPVVTAPGAKVAAADRALASANLAEARRAYREVLDAPGVDHATYIRVGEGFYRARDFANALIAFQRAGTLRNGEEAYHYYVAVAAYETGDYERAKRELNAALPHIEVTDDVQRYRTKIEGSR